MVKALFNGLISLLLGLAGILGSIIIYPLQLLLVSIFPNFGDFTATVINFFTTKVFVVVAWIKGLFLNLTGFPVTLFQILVFEVTLYLSLAVSIRSLFLIYRLYLLIRGKQV